MPYVVDGPTRVNGETDMEWHLASYVSEDQWLCVVKAKGSRQCDKSRRYKDNKSLEQDAASKMSAADTGMGKREQTEEAGTRKQR